MIACRVGSTTWQEGSGLPDGDQLPSSPALVLVECRGGHTPIFVVGGELPLAPRTKSRGQAKRVLLDLPPKRVRFYYANPYHITSFLTQCSHQPCHPDLPP